MGNRSPVSSRAGVGLHPDDHQNQVNDTTHPTRMDNTDDRLAERRLMAQNGTCRDTSRPPMVEVHQSSGRLQQGQPPTFLDRASFPVEAGEERERASLDSEDFVVIVRRATTS